MTQLSQSIKKIHELNTCIDHSKLPNYDMKDTLLYMHNPSIQCKIKVNYKYEELTLTFLEDLIKQYLTEELITTESEKLFKDNYNNNYKSSNKKTFNTKKKRNESSNSKYSNKQQRDKPSKKNK